MWQKLNVQLEIKINELVSQIFLLSLLLKAFYTTCVKEQDDRMAFLKYTFNNL